LILQVCEGVQHAHQKGIMHRDIKPSNILVQIEGDKAIPKIIDFGVAKATERRLTEQSVFTEVGELIGTPVYMSPEQAEMSVQDIDTRADVYSLGMLSYELLVGVLPFGAEELQQVGLDQFRKKIREEEPTKPSRKFDALPDPAMRERVRLCRTTPSRLHRELAGDLDWIILKCLEKDRIRRYKTASDLAEDINRYLRHEPVTASPPSTVYRMHKVLLRHKVGAVVTAATFMLLLGLAVIMAVQTHQISQERDRANDEATLAGQVLEYLVETFDALDPSAGGGHSITAKEVLDAGVGQLDRLESKPEFQSRLMVTIGRLYGKLGLHDDSRPLLKRALSIDRQLYGEMHTVVAKDRYHWGWILSSQGEYDLARPELERALTTQQELLPDEHPDVLTTRIVLANVLSKTGDLDGALAQAKNAVEECTIAPKTDPALAADAYRTLGSIHRQRREFELARSNHEQALDILQKASDPDRFAVAYASAKGFFEQALAIKERAFPEDSPKLASSIINLAEMCEKLNEYDEAASLYDRAVSMGDHQYVIYALKRYAKVLRKRGDNTRAEEIEDRIRRRLSESGVVKEVRAETDSGETDRQE
jgi:tetratricopeptide (TPR) repeat protein